MRNKIMNLFDDFIMADLTEKVVLTIVYATAIMGMVSLIIMLVK
jgi:hypothetical protein